MSKTEKILILVESPTKVKTISEILKKAGYNKATVMASVGHIMKLADGGPAYNSGIYPKQKFKMNLVVSDDKKKIVEDIKLRAGKAEKIFISSDDDREGAVIGWSLIKFCDLPIDKCFRAVMHEITPKAVINAIENPIPFNNNLVDAGFARMMTDKLIGFSLSPLAKKYIGAKSIGRCQSVGLKLVADREKEIENFIPELYFNLFLNFAKEGTNLKAKYIGYKDEVVDRFSKQSDVDAVVNDCKGSTYTIESIEKISHKESPKPPFCTATFQQEAASKLGLRVKDAMSCAQKLFEGIKIGGEHIGLCTYLRTDSTNMAEEFMPSLETYIKSTYGSKSYCEPRKSKKKSTDQDGHEAFRIVDPSMTPEKLAEYISNPLLVKVYKLVWQRTVASAMPAAEISETRYTIKCKDRKFSFSSKEIVSAGYKAVYEFEDNQILGCSENFQKDEILLNTELEVQKDFTRPKSRFSEASLVKELQRLECGRPSTFATIVETVLSPTRGYAKLEEKHIVPTDRGRQLADYCDRSFPTLINLNYTREMEDNLDKIANGILPMLDYMENFYNDLQGIVETTNETGIAPEMPEKKCPECGNAMVVRRSRFGKLFYGCSKFPKCRGILGID